MSRVPLRYDVVEERSYIFPKDDYPGRDALDELINSNNVLDEQRMRSLEVISYLSENKIDTNLILIQFGFRCNLILIQLGFVTI